MPRVAPVNSSCAFPVVFFSARYGDGLDPVLGAKLKLGVAGTAFWVAEDAGAGRLNWVFGRCNVGEFFVFVSQCAGFQATVQGRAIHTLRKMAPVIYANWALVLVGTGCDEVASKFEKIVAELADPVEADHCAWFDYGECCVGGRQGGFEDFA